MRRGLLKSLLGKHICSVMRVAYCHVDSIIVIEGVKAIATVIIKTMDGRTFHWILETSWLTDCYGVHSILDYKIIREDELDGEYASQNEVV